MSSAETTLANLDAAAPLADAADPASAPAADAPPITVIEPRPGWQLIRFDELWRRRELIYFLTWRDISVRYKQTVLGAAWAIIQPFMTMVVFTIFFGRFGKMEEFTDLPYPIVVYAALLPWQFFSQSVTQSGQSLVNSANMISKVYFPRLIIPISSVGAGLVDFAISFGVMLCLMAYYQVIPSLAILLLPLLLVLTLLTALGVGSLLSALTVSYRDFRYVVPFMIQLWMFASPVAYPLDIVPERFRDLYALNPIVGIIEGYRAALLGSPVPWGPLGISALVSVAVCLGGLFYFRRTERRFADIV